MANNQANVVKYFRKKLSDSGNSAYEAPTYIGAEQRFVSALRNSVNNNLEEQYLLGSDCETSIWQDEDKNYSMWKEYYVKSANPKPEDKYGSYRVESVIYQGNYENSDYYFTNTKLMCTSSDGSFNENVFILDNSNSDNVYTFDDEKNQLRILPAGMEIIRKDILKFIDHEGKVVEISTKVTTQGVEKDENENIIKDVISEQITKNDVTV